MKEGDMVHTPRFLGVRIEHVYDTLQEMYADGYTEPTHYKGDYIVCGKSLDMYHMRFACTPLKEV